jgi:hypothetical protein
LKEENMVGIHGIKIARLSPYISHLLFADDVMIFCKANREEAAVILRSLNTYAQWSGQRINFAKFAIFYSKNCKASIKTPINDILKLPPIPARAKYLGIPLILDGKKRDSFIDLK